MVIVRPVTETPWIPEVTCLLTNPLFLLYLCEESAAPHEDFQFDDDDYEDEDDDDGNDEDEDESLVPLRSFVTMLAPTFAPVHWFTLTDVIREQDDQWD